MPSLKALKRQLSKPWKDKLRVAVIAVLALMAALSVYQGIRNALTFSQDFQWDAAKALVMRLDPYELSEDPAKAAKEPELSAFYRMFTDQGLKQQMEANQFPSLLMLLFPMTVFPPDTAKIVWCVLNLAFTAGIIILVRKTFFENVPDYDQIVIFLLMLAGTPYRNQLGVGQHTLFSFFFFMLAVYIERKRPSGDAKSMLLTALCLFVSYFKYTLTAPLALYFLYKRRYWEIALSVAGHVLLTAVAARYLGKSFIYMIKAPLAVASHLASQGGMDLGVILPGVWAYAAAAVLCAALIYMALRMPEGREGILFPVLILWSLVLVYHRIYDYFVIVCVAAVFYTDFGVLFGKTREKVMKAWYAVLVADLFFLMRLFGEGTASTVFAAVLYYTFTITLTYFAFRTIPVVNDGRE